MQQMRTQGSPRLADHAGPTSALAAAPLPGSTHPSALGGGGEAPAGDSRRVLVVEDNRDGLETLMALLDMLGYATAGAGDGHEALRVAREFRPHIVLLDLGLPGMDGYQVAQALRADPQFQGLFIAALTGWGAEGDRRRTADAGFDAHLTKPVELGALEATLARTGP
jgi:CheY-like chemotaxis protein